MNSNPFRIIAAADSIPQVSFVVVDTRWLLIENSVAITMRDMNNCQIEIIMPTEQADMLLDKLVQRRDLVGSRWHNKTVIPGKEIKMFSESDRVQLEQPDDCAADES